jgi:hypothetical protein
VIKSVEIEHQCSGIRETPDRCLWLQRSPPERP